MASHRDFLLSTPSSPTAKMGKVNLNSPHISHIRLKYL